MDVAIGRTGIPFRPDVGEAPAFPFENEALEWVRPVGKIGKQKTELCRRGFSARKLLCSAGQCVVRQYDLSQSVAQGEGKDKIVNIPGGPQKDADLHDFATHRDVKLLAAGCMETGGFDFGAAGRERQIVGVEEEPREIRCRFPFLGCRAWHLHCRYTAAATADFESSLVLRHLLGLRSEIQAADLF